MMDEQKRKQVEEEFEELWKKEGYNYSAITQHYRNTKFIAQKFYFFRAEKDEDEAKISIIVRKGSPKIITEET